MLVIINLAGLKTKKKQKGIRFFFFKKPREGSGIRLPRFSGEQANDCNFVAHREPWGVRKLLATTILRLSKKLQQKNFQRIGFLDFKFNQQIYKFCKDKLMIF